MLSRLIKHEIKATKRLFIPLYLSLLVFAFVNRFINPIERISNSVRLNIQNILGLISFTIYLFLIVGVSVMTLVIMIQRFYKNLLGDEGYLMFTLPVKPRHHIISKLLIAVLWTIGSLIITILSVLILSNVNIGEMREILSLLKNQLETSFGSTGFYLLPLYALVMIVSNIVMVYTAITLGHLSTKHKVVFSFVAYVLIYFIYQSVLLISIVIYGFVALPSLNLVASDLAPTPAHMNSLFGLISSVVLILTFCNMTLINHILEKKLNLE